MQVVSPRNAQEALRQARVFERAARLFQDGYTAYQTANRGIWGVYSPTGNAYTVNLNGNPTCDCPDFGEYRNYCKHTLGLLLKLDEEAREEAMCQQAEELLDGQEFMENIWTEAETRSSFAELRG